MRPWDISEPDGSFDLEVSGTLFERQVRLRLAQSLESDVAAALEEMLAELRRFESEQYGRQGVLTEVRLLHDWAQDALVNIRRLRDELEADDQETSLVEALEQDLEDMRRAGRTALEVKVAASSRWPRRLRARAAMELQRIVQEAVQNARLHGGATRIRIGLRVDGATRAVVTISDNGRGMDGTIPLASHGLGLVGMRERAELLGGSVRVRGRQGGGTLVRVELPLQRLVRS